LALLRDVSAAAAAFAVVLAAPLLLGAATDGVAI